jgi:hypothetical protein
MCIETDRFDAFDILLEHSKRTDRYSQDAERAIKSAIKCSASTDFVEQLQLY